jgi:NTE family protein
MSLADPKLGLGLGGGAVRGAAHLGVLQVFDEAGVSPQVLAGTSIGAFVAALYAFGKTPEEILALIRELEFFDIARIRLNKLGLMSHDQMGDVVEQAIGDRDFSESRLPLAIVATDLAAGTPVVMTSGSVTEAVLASTCIPGLFTPVEKDGRLLVDGGLVENVPVSQLAPLGADVIVGVNLNAAPDYGTPQDLVGVLFNATDIAIDTTTRIQMQATDVAINMSLSQYDRVDPDNIAALYEEGLSAGRQSLAAVQQALEHAEPNILERLEAQARHFVEDHWPYS